MGRMGLGGGGGAALAVLVLASLGRTQSQQTLYADKTQAGLVLQTPPNGFVFPVRCGLTADTTEPRTLQQCDTVSFHVLLNMTVGSDFTFSSFGDMRDGTNPADLTPCSEPTDSTHDQRCGQEILALSTVQPDTTGTCVPSCDSLTGVCACQQGTTGRCTCFRAKRFTVQPRRFARIGDAGVCFDAISRTAGAPLERRCVYFDVMIAPYRLTAVGPDGGAIAETSAVVGQTLRVPVRAYDLNRLEPVAISVRPNSVELPNQEWAGPAYCPSTGATTASLGMPCQDAVWERTLVYTPRMSEQGMQYTIFFDARDSGLSAERLAGQTTYRTASALAGASCRDRYGLCDTSGQSVSPTLSPVPGLVVNVVQQAPVWMQGRISEILYSTPGVQVATFLSAVGSPAEGSRMPKAYVNCPIEAFGVYAYKKDAVVELSLLRNDPPMASAQDFGLVVSEQLLFRHFNGGNDDLITDLNSYYPHIRVTWTPPVGSEGRDFRLCFQAKDEFSASTLCVVLPVMRCHYCAKSDDTLKLLAERFNTHWLQIWSANDADFATEMGADFRASSVRAWNATENPHHIEPGLLVRLGPVWKTRHDYTLGYAAERFKTTVARLMLANPDLGHDNAQDSDILPAGSEVCIIPGICTPSDPESGA